ncbi:hypothetical protein METHB2_130030 [Candidatus Methylobacter favarea]|uniref:Uncharacterized protein n=1 Tax=Candidatus Methylobacter favarea TaxID=2707345 RepID=A0A8S0X744_9GAMM|nr:hypothetical protein METHB2_130030 [Candidatus Methylobacter favarea]
MFGFDILNVPLVLFHKKQEKGFAILCLKSRLINYAIYY